MKEHDGMTDGDREKLNICKNRLEGIKEKIIFP